MIDPAVVREIKRLRQRPPTVSQNRHITGVSRGTVGAIANGKRRDRNTSARDPEMEVGKPSGPPRRCSGCGGLVYMPCRMCHVRTAIAESSIPPRTPRPEEPPQLELFGEDLARYEPIHEQRICSAVRR